MTFFLKLFIAFVLVGINNSCTQAGNNRIYFPASKMKGVNFKPTFPNVFVGIPRDLYIVENNLMILDEYEGKQLTLVDLNKP